MDSFELYQASFLTGAWIVNAIVQVACFRFGKFSLVLSLLIGYGTGLACLVGFQVGLMSLFAASEVLPWALVLFIIYSATSYCYFHYVHIGEASVRIRVLKELRDSTTGLSKEALFEKYDSKNIIEVRLNRLIKSGQIRFENGRYFNANPRMLYVAKLFRALKLVILGPRATP